AGRFTAPDALTAGDTLVKARRFVVASGSSPAVPPIPGLEGVPYLTNETIFELTERPAHLIVIGGGPIGAELAQAQRRLGARVSLLEMHKVLGRDDPEVTAFARRQLVADGVEIHEGIAIRQVARDGNAVAVTFEENGAVTTLTGSHLLIAAGRKANVEGLGLDAAGVAHTPKGIAVDARLRSSNKRIFAVGDVAVVDGLGGYQFTHLAGYHAAIVLRNALFRLPAKVDYRALPWVTFTDPEIAHVGLTEAAARERHGDGVRALTWPFANNDRAQTERATSGLVKVVVGRRGRILGASIAGRHAGELLQPWVLAIGQGLKVGAVAGMFAPYPTLGEASKRAAGSYYTPTLFGARTRKLVRLLQRLG
ncbi:MAG: dihydrolipoyl dehydrogenase family protein, partial [Bacteroidota bacterium]|nr:FAD-dependent oxidoreductase [Kiloniellaceae bacterium]